jgi:hypothetical protein
MNYQYAYLLGDLLILFPIWLIFFLRKPDLRTNILTMSFLFGIFGPISEFWYLQDYWHPQTFTGTHVGIEDFLFGFLLGGIASVLYLELFNKHISKQKNKDHHIRFLLSFVAIFIFLISFYIFGVNSIYASIIVFLSLALLIYFFRPDLFVDSLMSGIFLGLTMFLSYILFLYFFPDAIHKWWFLGNISGILILGIPLEELLWAFSFGLVAGPTYEFVKGFRILKK